MLTKTVKLTSLAMLLMMAAGCAKSGPEETSAVDVKYDVSVSGKTKATLYNEVNDLITLGVFKCSAYNNTKSKSLFTNTDVKYSGSKWATDEAYTWQPGEDMTYHAFAPATVSGVSMADDGTGITISGASGADYAILPNAENHIDIMLGRYYGGGEGTGTANIVFEHPFTAVRFKMGDIDDYVPNLNSVDKITISGIYNGGKLNKWNGGSFIWIPSSQKDNTVTLTIGGKPEETGDLGTDAFILIPQSFSESAAATLTVHYTFNTSESGIIVATINSGSWDSGKVYTYTVNYRTMLVTVDDSAADSVQEWTTETTTHEIDAN